MVSRVIKDDWVVSYDEVSIFLICKKYSIILIRDPFFWQESKTMIMQYVGSDASAGVTVQKLRFVNREDAWPLILQVAQSRIHTYLHAAAGNRV